jgi:hypothetical protein
MTIKNFKEFLNESDPQTGGGISFLSTLGSVITGSKKQETSNISADKEKESTYPNSEEEKNYIPSGAYSGKTVLSQGTLYLNTNKSAPLVVIFGGTDVGGRKSGKYMLDYFTAEKTKKYTYYIANSASINGKKAWKEIQDEVKKLGLTPVKKILYLFSGGYSPAMYMDPISTNTVQKVDYLNSNFDKIYLVDIWIGRGGAEFYRKLAEKYGDKVEYYSYGGAKSAGGSANLEVRSYIVKKAFKSFLDCSGHMTTNIEAIKSLNATY